MTAHHLASPSTPALVETVARTIFQAQQINIWGGSEDEETYHWKSVSEGRKDMYREMAEAALRVVGEQDEEASEQVA